MGARTSLCAKTSRSRTLSSPPCSFSCQALYFATASSNFSQGNPQRYFPDFSASASTLRITSLVLFNHLSQFIQTTGPFFLSCSSRSIPVCNSLIRLAICLLISLTRMSSLVRVLALKNCSKRPFSNVPKSRGPILRRARRRSIDSSTSRSIKWLTCGPYIRRSSLLEPESVSISGNESCLTGYLEN